MRTWQQAGVRPRAGCLPVGGFGLWRRGGLRLNRSGAMPPADARGAGEVPVFRSGGPSGFPFRAHCGARSPQDGRDQEARVAFPRPDRDHGPMRTVPPSATQASARPAPGGRWPVAVPGPAGPQGTVARGRGKRAAFPGPARTGESTVTASMAGAIAPAKVLRWHQDQPGAKAPGQRPTRPRRALPARRAGRWPFVVPGPAGLQGTVPHGRGKRRAFPDPARGWARRSCRNLPAPAAMAKAIAFATAIRCDQHQPGAKAPGQRPTRPWRALRPRRVGRWPFVVPGPTGLQGTVPRGRGNAVRFMVPPGEVKALSPFRWQGPSPLPQRYIGIRISRRPKPPASARPARGGRFVPAGPGAGLSWCPDPPV